MNQHRRILQPMLLATILALGFAVAWVSIGAIVVERLSAPDRIESLLFTWPDATPLVSSYPLSGADVVSYRTLQGKPIEVDTVFVNADYLPGMPARRSPWSRLPWSRRVIGLFSGGGSLFADWWFIHDGRREGSGYFAGYDPLSKQLIGYIGRKGFSALKPPPGERFAINGERMGPNAVIASAAIASVGRVPQGYSVVYPERPFPGGLAYVAADDGLAEVDLTNRSVRTILKVKGPLSIAPVEQAQRSSDVDGPEAPIRMATWLAVRQEDRILLLDASGKQRLEYPLPVELRPKPRLSLLLSDSTAVVYTMREANRTSTYTIFWINQQGDVLRREVVKLGRRQWWSKPRPHAIAASLVLPAPAIVTPYLVSLLPKEHVGAAEAPDYPTAVARMLATTWPVLLVLNALGVGLAWLVYRRHRRLGQPWAGAWAVFVFLFGIPGLLGYLFHRSWPVRLACPRCAEPVPRDREACLACGQEFPEPPRKGTEILA